MSVALVHTTAVELGQAAEPLGVQKLARSLEFAEVLLDAAVRELRDLLAPKRSEG
jgi:hypothetical protein